jgi:hypothetical protein
VEVRDGEVVEQRIEGRYLGAAPVVLAAA